MSLNRCGMLEFSPMSCCAPGAELTALPPDARASDEEVLLASRIVGRRPPPDRPVRAGDSLRRLHPDDREGAWRACRASKARGPTCRPNA